MGRELPSDWNSRRKKVYKRDDYECQYCGRKGGPRGSAELHAHHNMPRHSGGNHKLSNLTTYCRRCHNAIHYDSKKAPDAVKKKNIGGMEWTITESHRQDLDSESASDKDTPDSESTVQSETEENVSTSDNQTESGIIAIAHSLKEFFVAIRKIEIESETSPTLEICPICGKDSTKLPRILPPDTVDCTACGARFKSGKFGFSSQMTLIEGGSDRTGETHTVGEWESIAKSVDENAPPTNLLSEHYE